MRSTDKRDPAAFRRIDDAVRASSDSGQLAASAMSLLGCASADDVYDVIADFMAHIAPGSVIVVNEVTPDLEWLITRRVRGLDESLLAKAAEMFGVSIEGSRWAMVPAYREEVLSGEVSSLQGGTAELAAREIPRKIATSAAKMMGFRDVFTIGIADGRHALGSIRIITREPDVVLPTRIIESFVHHCYSTLESIVRTGELAESAERNRLMLRNMTEGLALHEMILDADGKAIDYRFIDVNLAFESVTGLKADDIVGRTVLEVLPGTEPEWIERYGIVAATGVSTTFESYAGELKRHLEVTAYSPQPGQFVSVVSDITERKKAEDERDLNSLRIQALLKLNTMAEATDREITDFVLEQAVGLTRSEIGYLAFLDDEETTLTMHSWSRSAMAECAIVDKPLIYLVDATGLWGEAVRQRRPVITNDYVFPDPLKKGYPEGHVALRRHMNVPVFDGPRIVAIVGVGNKVDEYDSGDIQQLTLVAEGMWRLLERKRAHEAILLSAERNSTILQTAMDGFWLTDTAGHLLVVNDAYCQMSGYSEHELLSIEISDLEAEMTPERISATIDRLIEHGSDRFESCHRRKDGTTFDVEVSIHYRPADGGQLAAFLRDITERKRLEDALQQRLVALTQPPTATGGGLAFSDLFDIEQIQSIQDAFSAATGVASIITTPEGLPITRPSNYSRFCTEVVQGTERGRLNCLRSDASVGFLHADAPVVRCCLSAGLWDAGASITAGGEHVANWLIGQVRNQEQDDTELLGYADEIGADRADFAAALSDVPRMSFTQFESVAQALIRFANQLSVVAYQNVQQARFIADERRIQSEVLALNEDLEREAVERGVLTERLAGMVTAVIDVLDNVTELRDPYTAGHQRRVAEIAAAIAREMGMSDSDIADVRVAGLMHDIGKMSVPAEILSKPSALTAIEYTLIKGHAEAGYSIIESAHVQGPIAELVHQHHERCDGSGYPRGLVGDELLPGAKVLMVADVVEAMSSHRPYRAALGLPSAVAEIEQGAGGLYDSEVSQAFRRVVESGFAFSDH